MSYPCAFGCKVDFATFREAKLHTPTCPARQRRLAGLGSDLAILVDRHTMTLEEAEQIQASRPRIRL